MARGGSGAGSHGLSGREVPVPTKLRPAFPGTCGALTAGSLAAVNTLIELQKPASTPAVRLGVAPAFLELALKVRDASDFEERLAAMEQQAAAAQPQRRRA